MECKIRKKARKWLILGGILLLTSVLWGYQVYAINNRIPQVKITTMSGGQWSEWKDGVELKVESIDFMDDVSIRQIDSEELFYDSEMKLLLEKVQIRNTSAEEREIDLLDIGAESAGWCNIPDVQFYNTLENSEGTMRVHLKSGEQVSYRLPYLFLKVNFREKEWEKIENKRYYNTLSLYPYKKMITMN